MNYPENMPSSENIKNPITEAEIAKQGYELDGRDVRVSQLIAHQALIDDPESVKILGDLLTGHDGTVPSAMDSKILRSALHIEDSES